MKLKEFLKLYPDTSNLEKRNSNIVENSTGIQRLIRLYRFTAATNLFSEASEPGIRSNDKITFKRKRSCQKNQISREKLPPIKNARNKQSLACKRETK